MYGKLIVAAVAVFFLCVQLGATLQCYSCNSHNDCKKPSSITCDQKNANSTRNLMTTYFVNVPYQPSDNFNCVFHNYTYNNAANITYKGCVFRSQPDSCHLQLNASYINLSKQNCTECSGNHCNGRNSASSYSTSSFTLLASIMGVIFAKMLVH